MARIVLGIPCYDKVAPEVLEDYMRMMYYFGRRYPEHDFWLGIKTKSEQFRARNSIVEAAYQVNADYLLFLDDDHIIDFDGLNYATEKYEFLRVLLGHMEDDPKLALVGALYYHRGGQCRPVLLKQHSDKEYRYLNDDEITGGLQEVDVQGGGLMLIRMKALDFVGAPWFEPEIEFGTDFQICRKLAKAGWKIASDTSIEIGHVESSRRIITSKNRHQVQADSGKVAQDLEVSSRLLPIYREFRDDIQEYLGVATYGELVRIANEYKGHYESFQNYVNKDDYYRNGGRAYVARAAVLARVDANWPATSDDHLLRSLRPGVAAIAIDFGCGAGRLSFEFARAGHYLHFIDLDGVPTYEFLKWRVQKHGVLAAFDWPVSGTADYAIANDVFEHIPEYWPHLGKIVESLKPGGILFTNYLLMNNWENPEHINNDKPGFIEALKDLEMMAVNPCTWQKVSR